MSDSKSIAIGLDIGSTTVKAVVCDALKQDIIWSDYRRHEAQQAEMVYEFLIRIGKKYPHAVDIQIFCTGSGSSPLIEPLSARFIQEVNAVTLAVEKLHPDVNSVIELGGQDAKMIMFRPRTNEQGSIEKQAIVSMNDKCASGTGTTIDKCMSKLCMSEEDVANLNFDSEKLHHVAAKCGVFAETDVVNLIKNAVPAPEIMNSVADAIVMQNLSVLTRGNTLHHNVLLLGGPNTYLPFLIECWRLRIPETWKLRGYEFPQDRPIEELVFVPKNSQYYAAFGAVVFGLLDNTADNAISYRGLDGLKEYISTGRNTSYSTNSGSPLANSQQEITEFKADYTIPDFSPAVFENNQRIQGVIGLDGGSTSSKAVLIDYESGDILYKSYTLSKGNPIQDTKDLLTDMREYVNSQGAILETRGFGATGYAANVLEEVVKADVNIVETVAHMMAAVQFIPDADVICDIGGQDIKVLFLNETNTGSRDIRDFRLSNQCSAGNGMLLQAMADQFGIKLEDYADHAFAASISPKFNYGCGVFLDADRINFQKEGYQAPEMLAGLAQVLPKNIWQYVVQIPRLAEFGRVFVLQGGTQRNLAAVKAQVDYIKQRVPDAQVIVHPHCAEAGAIGAAMETLRVVKRRKFSTFIGVDATIDVRYQSLNDETTVCHFCPNLCQRTFIDSTTPDGKTSRYISGFSCEKGTVESKDALKLITKSRKESLAKFPNLVAEEAELAFKHFYNHQPMPAAGTPVDDVKVTRLPMWQVMRRRQTHGFRRSGRDFTSVKIGLPRVLNMYSLGPFFQSYFETLGFPKENIVWSPVTSEELWLKGGKYGSIDPCFPSKVILAHVHELIFTANTDKSKRRGPLDYIYYPCITHIPTWVTHTVDTACCPIVAGSPNVVKAAFTKEVDFFAKADIEYIDKSLSFTEPNLLKTQLFDTWYPCLGITEDENDFAVDQGFMALQEFNKRMESRGNEILQQVEQENRIAVLLNGRPYHNDPGINHGILDEFQMLGYPVLSMRSIPKQREWLQTYFNDDDPLDIRDVWPENFSVNSVQKVWATRFAARHPNIAILDLSSFKCGHDAPTYGIVDRIVRTSHTPYTALHDIDANIPKGSMQIRVKTYAYKLKRIEEELADKDKAKTELAKRIAEKRHELEKQFS